MRSWNPAELEKTEPAALHPDSDRRAPITPNPTGICLVVCVLNLRHQLHRPPEVWRVGSWFPFLFATLGLWEFHLGQKFTGNLWDRADFKRAQEMSGAPKSRARGKVFLWMFQKWTSYTYTGSSSLFGTEFAKQSATRDFYGRQACAVPCARVHMILNPKTPRPQDPKTPRPQDPKTPRPLNPKL